MSDLDIAIIGMAGRFPGARDIDSYWSAIRAGRELISHFTRDQLLEVGWRPEDVDRPGYIGARGVLDDADLFDAGFFGFSPREAEVLDPQHRLFLECAWESLEDAGYDPGRYAGLIGVFAGVGMNTYLLKNIIPHEELVAAMGDFQIMALNDKDTLPSRVSYKLNLRGPSVDIQTSCSTGLVSVQFACDSLNSFGCDIALAGSVAVKFPQRAGYRYLAGGILSPDGHCRAFDARAEGTVGGGGLGIVVLKRLAEALEDGDRIHAVIRGGAVNNDGNRKVSYAAPSIAGQAEVIAAAMAQAGVQPETIGYVETHGTGTPIGDPIELEALSRAYRAGTDRRQYCAIGSVKTNIGHLDAASGMAGLIKAVRALQAGEIPPSLHYEAPNPKIDFESSPFFVCTELRPWPETSGPRRAGVSSFGVGGTNVHMILEQAPEPRPVAAGPAAPELLVWSTRDDSSLQVALERFEGWLSDESSAGAALGDVAYTLHRGRAAFANRAALVCRDRDHALRVLRDQGGPIVLRGRRAGEDAPEALLLFPGQGTQRAALAPELYRRVGTYRDEVNRCCEILRDDLGMDLRTVLYPQGNPTEAQERLRRTQLTQPAVFVLDYALAKTWEAWGVRPAALIGHSVGEYVAAVLAGVFSLEDALRMVAVRGRLIGDSPTGAMLSVRLAEAELAGMLTDEVTIAALNGPNATVLSGPENALLALEQEFIARDVPCRRLETSHAFHSPMLQPAANALERELRQINLQEPRIPIVSTVTGEFLRPDEARDPRYWARQVVAPVRFGSAVATLRDAHPRATWLEAGAGQSLANVVRPALATDGDAAAISSLPDPGSDLEALFGAAARLWVRGHDVDLASPYGEPRKRVGLPTYPFARTRYWVDAPDDRAVRPEEKARLVRKNPDLDAWFLTGGWKQRQLVQKPAPARDWLLFDDGQGLVAKLANEYDHAVRVRPGAGFRRVGPQEYTVDPFSADDYRALLDALAAEDFTPTGVVHAFGLAEASDFASAEKLGVYSLVALGRALRRPSTDEAVPVWVLTRNLFEVLGTEEVAAERATVLGAVRVLPQERPWIRCGLVDLDDLDTSLRAELARDVPEATVALRKGRRWVWTAEQVEPLSPNGGRVRAGGASAIFGGLGRFGRLAAGQLVRLGHTRIALIDHADVTPEVAAELAAMREQGADIIVVPADIADEHQVRTAVSEVMTQFGGLHGVIHAAGPEERLATIEEADAAECAVQFASKVHGLANVDRVLAEESVDLDFAIVTSSLASVLGGLGHTYYAAANAFADAFARKRGAVPWQSVSFETWNLTGEVTQEGAPGFGRMDLAMTRAETEAVLLKVLSTGSAQLRELIVSTADLRARIEQWIEPSTKASPTSGMKAVHSRPELAVPYVAPRTEIEASVTTLWEEMLGITPVGVHDSFFELGGDSLLVTRVASAVRARFQVELPLRQLFETPTPAEVALLIAGLQVDEGDLAAVEDLLAELGALPDDVALEELRKAGIVLP